MGHSILTIAVTVSMYFAAQGEKPCSNSLLQGSGIGTLFCGMCVILKGIFVVLVAMILHILLK